MERRASSGNVSWPLPIAGPHATGSSDRSKRQIGAMDSSKREIAASRAFAIFTCNRADSAT